MEMLGNEVAHGLGRFSCLPDDLLMSILNMIHDLKCLFQCTLVSKGFALKIHRTKSISLKLPAHGIDSTEASTNLFHLYEETVVGKEFFKVPKVRPPPSPRQEPKFIKFLQKFTELECASFESPCPKNPCSSPYLKWKVKLANCGLAVEMLVLLLPSTLKTEVECECECDDEDEDGEEEDGEEEDGEEGDGEGDDEEEEVGSFDVYPKHLAKCCLLLSPLKSFTEWFNIMFSLIKQHHGLKSVVFTDSSKHGKIVLDAEQIVEWRERLLCGELWHNPIPKYILEGLVPSSDLPLPGYPVKKSVFVVINFVSSPSVKDSLKKLEYDEEEKVIADTVNGILTDPQRAVSWTAFTNSFVFS